MISARLESPVQATAPVRSAPVRAGRDEREAASFDDALRDQETAAAAPDKDAPVPEGEAARAPDAAALCLALIAPWLPQTQTGAVRDERAARSPDAQDQPGTPTGDSALDAPLEAAALAMAPKVDQDMSAQKRLPQPRVFGEHDADARPVAIGRDAIADQGPARKQVGERTGAPLEEVRSVVVRHVASANHFPVVDPIRQIATQVVSAVEQTAAPAPSEPIANPVKTLSVQLEPESLGVVTLRMRLSGDHLSVRVDVAEPATLELIQRERDRLQKSMTTENVTIDRLEIRAAADPAPVASGDGANGPKQDMNAQGQGQQSRHNAAPQGGEARRERGGDSHGGQAQKNGQDHEAARRDSPRDVYL